MTRTDTFVVGVLLVLFLVVAGLIGAPALTPPAPSAVPTASPEPIVSRPYREGVVGRPVSVSPLSARTQADRDLVALVFSGLVRNGPDGTLLPDLADTWTVDPTGASWTFDLRSDASWHDGEPVIAEDVAFTIRTLQDPEYTGPGAGSWNDARVGDCRGQPGHHHAGQSAGRISPVGHPADRAGPPARRRSGRGLDRGRLRPTPDRLRTVSRWCASIPRPRTWCQPLSCSVAIAPAHRRPGRPSTRWPRPRRRTGRAG